MTRDHIRLRLHIKVLYHTRGESWNACDPHQFQYQIACRMATKELLSPSKFVNIHNFQLDGGEKSSVIIQSPSWTDMKDLLPLPNHFGWPQKKTFIIIQILKLMQITSVSSLTTRDPWPFTDDNSFIWLSMYYIMVIFSTYAAMTKRTQLVISCTFIVMFVLNWKVSVIQGGIVTSQ